MKKGMVLLLALLFLFGMDTTALAEDVHITATVPSFHTVTVEAVGGRIAADSKFCGSSVEIDRQKQQTWWIIPNQGKELSHLYYGGVDVTSQVKGGVFTAPAMTDNTVLKAVFQDIPPIRDKKDYDIEGTVTDQDKKPAPGAVVDIGGHTGTTDSDGKFTIKDVPPGTWPVVVIDSDGKVIGHGEITIGSSEGNDLTVDTDENGNPVIRPGSATEIINLTMEIGGDGSIHVADVRDATSNPPKQGDTSKPKTPASGGGSGSSTGSRLPKTGDTVMPWTWVCLLLLSGSLAGCLLWNRRKKINQNRYKR